MFLKRIELQGFKSFADKSIITFDSDVIGIVGPNGCGKSNINDAIRWVLGEQSVKSLRGTSMSDVIFNGSTERKPVNMAREIGTEDFARTMPEYCGVISKSPTVKAVKANISSIRHHAV